MGLRDLAGRCVRYVRHDLREIVAPSSLPDPPGAVVPRRLTWPEVAVVWRKVFRAYVDTWRSERPAADGGRSSADGPSARAAKGDSIVSEIKDEFAEVYKSGAKGMGPYLQRLAHMRASMVKDSLQGFTEGYKAGLEQAKDELSTPAGARPSEPVQEKK